MRGHFSLPPGISGAIGENGEGEGLLLLLSSKEKRERASFHGGLAGRARTRHQCHFSLGPEMFNLPGSTLFMLHNTFGTRVESISVITKLFLTKAHYF